MAFVGSWNVAPRAHPGDGLVNIVDADLGLGDRLKARSRLPSGTHVPHPDISTRRAKAAQVTFDRATPVYLDGDRVGSATQVSVRVEADALTVVV